MTSSTEYRCDRRSRIGIASLLSALVAAIWLVFGLGKVLALIQPSNIPGISETWAAQFPAALILCVAITEVIAGSLICFGKRRSGLVLGLVLLAVFSAALLVWPPAASQACGCGGVVGDSKGHDLLDPRARNFLLASLHLACLLLP